MEKIKCEQVGLLSGGKWDRIHEQNRRVYSPDGLASTVHTMGGGQQELKIAEPIAYDEQNGYLRTDGTVGTLTTDGSSPKHNNRIVEPRIAAMRGRNPDNPSDRTAGNPTEQRLEIGSEETINTLTTVQIDNLVVEPMIWGSLQANCAKKKDGICPTLTSAMGDGGGQVPMHNYDCLIRKLVPHECFKLMGVRTEDFEKVAQSQSDSGLWHLAGDSIVTACLMAIFGALLGVDYQSKINELVGELKQ